MTVFCINGTKQTGVSIACLHEKAVSLSGNAHTTGCFLLAALCSLLVAAPKMPYRYRQKVLWQETMLTHHLQPGTRQRTTPRDLLAASLPVSRTIIWLGARCNQLIAMLEYVPTR